MKFCSFPPSLADHSSARRSDVKSRRLFRQLVLPHNAVVRFARLVWSDLLTLRRFAEGSLG